MLPINWKAICAQTLTLVFSTSALTSGMAAVKKIDPLHFDDGKKVVIWDGMGILPYPLYLDATKANDGKLALGFSHLGYSEPDPDGRVATLSFAIIPQLKAARTSTDIIHVVSFKPDFIDISLPMAPVEEQRLRAALQMPRKITGQASLPFQVKWKGVDGNDLYEWLTNPQGLRWQLHGDLYLDLYYVVSEQLGAECTARWWTSAGLEQGDVVEVEPFILMTELLRQSCFETIASNANVATTVSAAYQTKFLNRLSAAGPNPVSLTQILAAGSPVASQQQGKNVRVGLVISFSPGVLLLANPSYVKDLSGSAVGLAGLKK